MQSTFRSGHSPARSVDVNTGPVVPCDDFLSYSHASRGRTAEMNSLVLRCLITATRGACEVETRPVV